MMQSIPFADGTLRDPRQGIFCHAVAVPLEGSLINEGSDRPLRAQAIPCVTLRGRTVTPGQSDARRHLVLTAVERPGEMAVTTLAPAGPVAYRAIARACCFVEHGL